MPPPTTASDDAARFEALLERYPFGGLLLFNGSLDETPALLQRLQQKRETPLLVASDIERGLGQQVLGGTIFPHAMALGAAVDPVGTVEAVARATAREALAAGIHITFAPVADVNRQPRNPIIGTRAFGTAPDPVARCVQAYIRGCRAEGLLTTAKHFPGHGGTIGDSHAELPAVEDARDALEAWDLPPFEAAVEAGADLMMTAHVTYPALDPEGRPATLSPPVLHDLLRRRMGFEGVVVTDSLLMGGIRQSLDDVGRRAAALVEAGTDVLLDPEDPEAVVEGLARAVEEGQLDVERLEAASARVQGLRDRLTDRFGADVFTRPDHCIPRVDRGRNEALARQVARQALRVVRGAAATWDEHDGDGLLVVHAAAPACGPAGEQPLHAALHEMKPETRIESVAPEPSEADEQRLQDALAEARDVVLVVQARPAAWHAYGLAEAQEALLHRIVGSRDVRLVCLGSPGLARTWPDVQDVLCTYSDVAASQHALAGVLAGRVRPAQG